MKNKATTLMKKVITALPAMAKARTLALKTKTRSLRTKLIIFSLLSNKKFLMSSFSHKLHNFMPRHHRHKLNTHEDMEEVEDTDTDSTVLHSGAMARGLVSNPTFTTAEPVMKTTEEDDSNASGFYTYGYEDGGDDVDEDKYPDLTHSMFDLDDRGAGGSVIDMVKNSKEEAGEKFCLEEEIDHVADLFIKRFHRQMKQAALLQ